jgi:hypothetical protein
MDACRDALLASGTRLKHVEIDEPTRLASRLSPRTTSWRRSSRTACVAPNGHRLIEIPVSTLASAQRAGLDAYHARVKAGLTPLLVRSAAEWLGAATVVLPP